MAAEVGKNPLFIKCEVRSFLEIYDYQDPQARVRSARFLGEYARAYRAEADEKWARFYEYYHGQHRTAAQIAQSCEESGIPWIPSQSPDPYFQVESQINAELPDFEFRGRDDDLDSVRARQREFVVRYILENNRVADQAAMDDRRCLITGTSAWKVFWDSAFGTAGDIRVVSIDPQALYPDPAAKTLEDCEYIQYVYPMHQRKFARVFAGEISRLKLQTEDFKNASDSFLLPDAQTYQAGDDTIEVIEHWYRDRDGDICCSIQAGDYELRHIEKYWRMVASGYNEFPFVIRYRTANPDSFWGTGDLEPILTLVDAVDRELSIAQLSSAFTGSDVILAEYDAFSEEPENRPGAIWRLKPGASGKVSRLGGLGNNTNRLDMSNSLRTLISETLGTLDVNHGLVSTNFSSASALQQLIERSETRNSAKKQERLGAYARLFRLIDWTALEFYDQNRIIFLGAGKDGQEKPLVFTFNAQNFITAQGYFPEVDTIIGTGERRRRGNSFELAAIEAILAHGITRENYPLVLQVIRMFDIETAASVEKHFHQVFETESAGKDIASSLQNEQIQL